MPSRCCPSISLREGRVLHAHVLAVIRAGTVVGEENDEGIVEFTGFFQIRDDASGFPVHSVDERGVGGHAAGFPIADFGREGIPCGDVIGAG